MRVLGHEARDVRVVPIRLILIVKCVQRGRSFPPVATCSMFVVYYIPSDWQLCNYYAAEFKLPLSVDLSRRHNF